MNILSKIFCFIFFLSTSSAFADWVKHEIRHPDIYKISITRNVLSVYMESREKWDKMNPHFCRFEGAVSFIKRYHSNHTSIDHFGCLELDHSHITTPGVSVLTPKMVEAFLIDFEFSEEERLEILKDYKAYLFTQAYFINSWIPFVKDPIEKEVMSSENQTATVENTEDITAANKTIEESV